MKLHVQDFVKNVICEGVSYDDKRGKLMFTSNEKVIAYIKSTVYGVGYYQSSNAPVQRIRTEEELQRAIDDVRLRILWMKQQ